MMETDQDEHYRLSCVIGAHSADVKSVAVTNDGTIFSGSRDGTVKAHKKKGNKYEEACCYSNNKGIVVNSVALCKRPDGGYIIFAGQKDGSIAVYDIGRKESICTLHKHKLNVCSLYVDEQADRLLSGSWDNSAIVWPITEATSGENFQEVRLVGHTMSVWAVATIPNKREHFLTGSADRTITYWKNDAVLATFKGHEDVVRSLLVLNNSRFLSCGNDSSVRLWDLENRCCIANYVSLTGEYIYDMSMASEQDSKLLLVCCENGFLDMWKVYDDGTLDHKEIIRTPSQSLWSVVFLPNNDFAVGADEGGIYVFTKDSSRFADDETSKMFDAGVATRTATIEAIMAAQKNDIVKIKVALDDGQPDIELRYKKGSDPYDAAKKFLLENNLPSSYLDEVANYIIENIPEAKQAANRGMKKPTKKTVVDGEEWDYALEVTIDDGRELKLPYNVGEDFTFAAQRFVEKHKLPIHYIKKIALLLHSQMASVEGTSNGFTSYSDPFTGNRYIPGVKEGVTNKGGSSFVADPFTGGSAYVSGLCPQPSTSIDKKRPKSELVPLNDFYKFGIEQASAKAIAKLQELNENRSENKLSQEQMQALEEVMKQPSYEANATHISAIELGFTWNIDDLVPVMDVFRLALLNRSLNRFFCSMESDGKGRQTLEKLTNFLISATSDPLRVLTCRAIANSASHQWGREMLISDVKPHISPVAIYLGAVKPNLQIAATSALANWALILLRHTEFGGVTELGPREDALKAILEVLKKMDNFSGMNEIALIRLLQAIVTLMWGDSTIIKLAKDKNIIEIVNRIKDVVVDEAGKGVARDIIEMAYAL